MSNLIDQASKGNLKAVRNLIDAGANVDAQDEQKRTALMLSSKKGYLEIVKALVGAGAALNLQGNERSYGGNTALMYACRNAHLGVVKTLVEAGANLNLQGKERAREEYTALIYATYNGYQEIAKTLIDAGANVNAKGKSYKVTALIISSEKGYLRIVKALVDAGADVNLQNTHGKTALIHASRHGHLEIVKSLIQAGANLNLQGQAENTSEKGWTALIHASRVGHLEIVKSLVDAGADLHLITERGWTALMHASDQDHKEVVKILQAAEPGKAHRSDPSHMSDLIGQTSRGNLKAVRDLIDAGVNVDEKDKHGRTALFHASREGHLEIVKTLIDARADVNVQDKYGQTALMQASRKSYREVIKVIEAAIRKARDSDARDHRSLMMFTSVFTALGHLSKIDGKVSQEEISFAANLMNKMQLDGEQRRQGEDLFRMGKQAPTIALITLLSNLKNEYKDDCESLHELMKTLMQFVYLDHVISEQERLAMKEIATQLGITKSALDTIEASLLVKSKDNKESTSSSQNPYSEKANQSTRKTEATNSNQSKLAKISANLFEISGYLAKLDGRISREEIKAITNLMNEMQLERDQRCQAEDLFRCGKQASEKNMIALVSNLQDQYHETPEVLNILVMILMEIAYSDGNMTNPEQQMIRTIALQLSLDEITLNSIEATVCCELHNIKYLDLHDAYKMLGVSDAASHRDIKQAYRNLLKTYHPHALQSKGLPKEMLVFGKRLSQTFNLAYDRIKVEHKL